MNNYKVAIIDSLKEWEELSKPWNELLANSGSNTIFLTWEWLFSWAESYLSKNKRLFILTIYKDNELVGIAPWYIHNVSFKFFTLKQIEFLGTPEGGSDYLDVFIKKGKEKQVTHSIYDFLLKNAQSLWDCFMLRDLPSNSLFLLHFSNRIEEDGRYSEIVKGSFCPVVPLPEKIDNFFSRLSSNRREQFNRHLKIIEKEGAIKHYSILSENIDTAFNDFFSLYEREKKLNSNLLRPFLKKFISRCKEKGWVQINLITSNGNIFAGLFHLLYEDTLSMYLMAVDKNFNPKISIGNILVGLCISKAIDEGVSTYDFLKGSEHYKFHWANEVRSSLNFFFYQKKITPLLFATGKFLKYTAKIALR